MNLIKSPDEMHCFIREMKLRGKRCGFVPTMGALHQGHLSLVKGIRPECETLAVSIFVNPTQFGPEEDFEEYPRDLEGDVKRLRDAGADVVFAPKQSSMYPPGFSSEVSVKGPSENLEGESRPGHFNGVTTIVLKLLNIVVPDVAGFGQKDAQQACVIKKMVRDLNLGVDIRVLPVIREEDGLAMSSRNAYLTPEERREAPLIYESLRLAKGKFDKGEQDPELIQSEFCRGMEEVQKIRIEYISPAYTEDFSLPEKTIDTDRGLVLVAACKTLESETRLIDNILLKGEI